MEYLANGSIFANGSFLALGAYDAPVLSLSCASQTAIQLQWVDNSWGIKDFVVERMRDDEISWSVIAVLAAGTVFYQDLNTSGINSYSYRVHYA